MWTLILSTGYLSNMSMESIGGADDPGLDPWIDRMMAVSSIKSSIENNRDGMLLAVSGGLDSMVLLRMFLRMKERGILHQFGVFHLNHMLREEAPQDDLLIRNNINGEVPLFSERWNVGKFARRTGRGVEEAGRLIRYRRMSGIAHKNNFSLCVTAHHAGDYFESVIMHMIRGSGVDAFSTMPILSGLEDLLLFRPLLIFTRKQIDQIARDCKISYLEDHTNLSLEYLRNRVRHTIAPLFYSEGMNPELLWQNNHGEDVIPFHAARSGYLIVPWALFGGADSRIAKMLIDRAMKGLALTPVSRSVMKEFMDQVRGGESGKVSIETSDYLLWRSTEGDLWVIRKNSPLFFQPVMKPLDLGVSISYNGESSVYKLKSDEKVLTFEPGLRVRIGEGGTSGSKKLKKVFQELRLPPPVRKNLPLIFSESSGVVTRICLHFIGSASDLRFE